MEQNLLHTFKFKPFHRENDGVKGKETVMKFYDNRIEYKINYKTPGTIKQEETNAEKDVELVVKEDGVIAKQSISGIVKYPENDISNGEVELIPVIEIFHGNSSLYLTFLEEETQTNIFKYLLNWKFN